MKDIIQFLKAIFFGFIVSWIITSMMYIMFIQTEIKALKHRIEFLEERVLRIEDGNP